MTARSEPMIPRPDAEPAEPSGAALPVVSAADQTGPVRPGEATENATRAVAGGGSEHGGTDLLRVGDRSRLVPRPRTGEPGVDGYRSGAGSEPADEPDGAAGTPEVPAEPGAGRTPGCQTDLPGWAGAHRHGAVRPSRRSVRRDRPPRRWC
ncbi:hypothetical protein [Plantactinospora endophytica]|uniref:hypothetical protein n=1 Tax=Plantactinospora endophytica TaxID=673535 RepID=UPI00366D7855